LPPEIELGELVAREELLDGAGLLDAAVEHEHRARAQIADEGHVVLDHAHRAAGRRLVAHDLLHRGVRLSLDAGHRLVEQQHLAVVHQRARKSHELLLAEGQLARQLVRRRGEPDALEDLARALHRPGARIVARPHEQVVHHAKGREQTHVLPGARDAQARALVHLHARERLVAQPDLTRIGRVDARDEIEERGLARAVRPDESQDLARGDLQVDAFGHDDAAEGLAHVDHPDGWRHCRARLPSRPAGRR
jgi:hypothetical protein